MRVTVAEATIKKIKIITQKGKQCHVGKNGLIKSEPEKEEQENKIEKAIRGGGFVWVCEYSPNICYFLVQYL